MRPVACDVTTRRLPLGSDAVEDAFEHRGEHQVFATLGVPDVCVDDDPGQHGMPSTFYDCPHHLLHPAHGGRSEFRHDC